MARALVDQVAIRRAGARGRRPARPDPEAATRTPSSGHAESVNAAPVVAGFGGGHCATRPPRGSTGTPAAVT